MSWAEVKKLNSDFINEPLNYNNYINDISVFGAESYVMDKQNESLYRGLIANSLAVFGHSCIHEYIYDRLTADDVDYMLVANGRLGQSFNSFYRCDKFANGGIDSVLKTMTADSYNTLESKFQHGINRYVEKFVSKSAGVGVWFDSIFGLDNATLRTKNTLAEIVNDDNLLNLIVTNESVLMTVCCNMTIQKITTTDATFKKLLTGIASSSPSTITLIEALEKDNKLETLFNDDEACRILVTHEESLRAITKNVVAFGLIVASVPFFNHLKTSTTAINIIVDAMVDCSKSSTAIKKAQTELETLRATVNGMPLIHNAVDSIDTAREVNNNTITAVGKVLSAGGDMVTNFNELLASNPTTLGVLCNSKEFLRSIVTHANAFDLEEIIRSDKRWYDALVKSSILQTKSWSGGNSVDGYVVCSNKCIIVQAVLYANYGWYWRYPMRSNNQSPTSTQQIGIVQANYYDMPTGSARGYDRMYAHDVRFGHRFQAFCNSSYGGGTTNIAKYIDLGE